MVDQRRKPRATRGGTTISLCSSTFEEYTERVRAFHGFTAPGVMIGGFMVDLAYRHLPKEGLFDAICETPKCLPDAVQLLTPCTIGNGWLTIVDTGRYALCLYDKSSGRGVRVAMDPARIDAWPGIKGWFFKLVPKKEQDFELLMGEIKAAGSSLCAVRHVTVLPYAPKGPARQFAICPSCKESYPVGHGRLCLGCQGAAPYGEPGPRGASVPSDAGHGRGINHDPPRRKKKGG
jgi:formylmethanofuran dehydrogenase subunit E